VNSIIRRSTTPISVTPLALNNLDIYNEHHSDGSNHFIYSRFLVPFLQNYSGWAIYIDGDMLLRDDISKLWDLKESEKALLVVKHKYKTMIIITHDPQLIDFCDKVYKVQNQMLTLIT
jgi:lipopolysaccharide biosynthesis glycosyltransferase